MHNRLVKLPEVTYITGLSRSTIYRLISRGQFPSPVSIGGKSRRWTYEALQRWIAQTEIQEAEKSDR